MPCTQLWRANGSTERLELPTSSVNRRTLAMRSNSCIWKPWHGGGSCSQVVIVSSLRLTLARRFILGVCDPGPLRMKFGALRKPLFGAEEWRFRTRMLFLNVAVFKLR